MYRKAGVESPYRALNGSRESTVELERKRFAILIRWHHGRKAEFVKEYDCRALLTLSLHCLNAAEAEESVFRNDVNGF